MNSHVAISGAMQSIGGVLVDTTLASHEVTRVQIDEQTMEAV